MKAFWPEEEGWGIWSVRLYDGLWQHLLQVEDARSTGQGFKLTAREKQRRPSGDLYGDDDIDDFGWRTLWAFDGVEHMLEDDYSRTHGLLATEWTTQALGSQLPKRQVMYVDPQKDYIRQRYTSEELIDAPWQEDKTWMDRVQNKERPRESSVVREVVEYGQTSAGQWYPKVINEKGYEYYGATRRDVNRITRIHLIAEHPAFPTDIFDPQALPKVSE